MIERYRLTLESFAPCHRGHKSSVYIDRQELRAKQDKIPLRDFSRRGIAKAEVMKGLSGHHLLWQEPTPLSV
jgi:hypothetical protein